jgi:hypothetical protein
VFAGERSEKYATASNIVGLWLSCLKNLMMAVEFLAGVVVFS